MIHGASGLFDYSLENAFNTIQTNMHLNNFFI